MSDTATDKPDDDGRERDMKILASHAAQLREHFDSVQIFVTRHQGDYEGTINADYGCGNWYSRVGQIKDWVIQQNARRRDEARQDGDD